MKKIAALIGTGALLLSVASSVLAVPPRPPRPQPGSRNAAMVTNEAVAVADTGSNFVSNGAYVVEGDAGSMTVSGGNGADIHTGKADADAVAVVAANDQVGCLVCGRSRERNLTSRNTAVVINTIEAGASAGGNTVGNVASIEQGYANDMAVSGSNGADINTGEADADAVGVVIVNAQVSFGR